jgi:Flp pilus assembly protein TadG
MHNRATVVGKRNGPGLARHESGQIIALFALALIVLCGMAGLAVDVGYARVEKRRMQTAADAAAMAAASASIAGDNYTSAARKDSSLNGFTDGARGVSVTVNQPPASGSYAGNNSYLEAVVSQTQPTFLLNAFGIGSIPVAARAVAYIGSAPSCIYALGQTGTDITLNGSAAVNSQCGVMDDSSGSPALVGTGSAQLTASAIDVVGQASWGSSIPTSPTAVAGVVPVSDPLSYLTPPTVGGCTQTNYHANSTTTIGPGTYCGGIQVNGGSTTLNLTAGTYILEGGGLQVNGGASLDSVNSDGSLGGSVMFYNTQGAGYGSGSISISGGSVLNLTAPTSGAYAGILFSQDPTNTDAASFTGSSSSIFQGALYFPTAALTYSGSSAAAAYTILVAQSITFTGSSSMNDNYSSLPGGVSPIKVMNLAE